MSRGCLRQRPACVRGPASLRKRRGRSSANTTNTRPPAANGPDLLGALHPTSCRTGEGSVGQLNEPAASFLIGAYARRYALFTLVGIPASRPRRPGPEVTASARG